MKITIHRDVLWKLLYHVPLALLLGNDVILKGEPDEDSNIQALK